MSNRLSDNAQAALDKVINQLKTGNLSDVVKVARISLPDDAPAGRWSLGNRVLAYFQTHELDCRTYNQWKEVGRQVTEKGAAFILGPVIIKKKEIDSQGVEKEFPLLVGFKSIPVFNYTKTKSQDGNETAFSYEPKDIPDIMKVADAFGVKVKFAPLSAAYGSFDNNGTITMGSDDVGVFFHELAHAVDAQLSPNGKLKGGQQTDQETVAEFTAAVLMELYGYGDVTGNMAQYINFYSSDVLKETMKVMDRIGKIIAVIDERVNLKVTI